VEIGIPCGWVRQDRDQRLNDLHVSLFGNHLNSAALNRGIEISKKLNRMEHCSVSTQPWRIQGR
jgi:hypothetical protein